MPAGRPTDYTEELAALICGEIAKGQSLRKVCSSKDTPNIATIYLWFRKYPEFIEQYALAKEESGDADQDRLDEIAERVLNDDLDPQKARVAADIIKWSASKKKPKKYGDRITTEHTGSVNLSSKSEEELMRELAMLKNGEKG